MSRRTEIADATIKTLAAEGMRGLTHRAVDRTAGLPEGSTSYYFRTRSALLEAVVDRFLERLDQQLAEWMEEELPEGVDVADRVAGLVIRWATADREAQIARYELGLESTRRPELQPKLAQARVRVHRMIIERLGAAPASADDDIAWYTAPIEGMLLFLIIHGDTPGVGREQIAAAIRRFI